MQIKNRGFVVTGGVSMLTSMSAAIQQALGQMVPFLSRLGLPVKLDRLVLHIAENRYINGKVIRLAGVIRMARE
ncbi:hypothetical protein NL42_15745 [Acinetobacter sp. GN11]